MSLNSFIFNYNCKKSDDKRDAGLTTPADICRFDNIPYSADPVWQVLDVYRPIEKKGKLPVIVSVHGGGWVYGTTKTYQFYCMNLAQRGFAVVNFNYRLAPKHKYPAALEDVNSAFAWVMEHSDEYDLDTNNIFALGDSAGAQLLGQYACVVTNPEYAKKFDFKVPDDLSLNAIALNCGVYNVEEQSVNSLLWEYIDKKRGQELARELTITHYIAANFPPSFIMTCNEDFLKEEPAFLLPVLDKYGIEYISKVYGDEEHLLGHVFHVDIKKDEAKICNDEECDFFRKYIK